MSSYSCWYWPPSSSSATLRGLSTEKAMYPCLSTRSVSLDFSNFTVKTKVEWNRPKKMIMRSGLLPVPPPIIISCCSSSSSTSTEAEVTTTATGGNDNDTDNDNANNSHALRVIRKRRHRYRKQYPGEKKGITEEMRFVAMRLRNVNGKKIETNEEEDEHADNDDEDGGGETWQPSMEGFLKYLVDSELVFNTVERTVDESNDVSYAYFRKTGLERSEGLSKDLEWFRQQDIVIPPPSTPGITYVKYLEELAEKNAPLFLCHFYNIYFSHIAGGQVIAEQVSEKLLEGRELHFYRWEGNAEELLTGVREKLNMLGEHWSRDEKNKCLREATKSFRHLGQIVRLIIL